MTGVWERAVAATLLLFGLVMIYFATTYKMGSLADMGPGYFPVVMGSVLAVVGVFNLIASWQSDAPAPVVPWLSFVLIFGGIIAWAFLIERLGLVPASVALIVLASLARRPVKPLQLIGTTVICSVASTLVFIWGFGLPLKTFVW